MSLTIPIKFICRHGLSREFVCAKCQELYKLIDGSIEINNKYKIYIKSFCPTWWIWSLLTPLKLETSQGVSTSVEDIIVKPQTDGTYLAMKTINVKNSTIVDIVTDDRVCYVHSVRISGVLAFPFDVYFAFEDERPLNICSVYVDAVKEKTWRTSNNLYKHHVEDTRDILFCTFDKLTSTRCYCRLVIQVE